MKIKDNKIAIADERRGLVHPSRNSRYELRVGKTPYCESKEVGLWVETGRPDCRYLEFIRQLSNESPNFRKELGDKLFSRIELRTSTPYHRFWHLSSFLEERLTINSGIKSLYFSISLVMQSWDDDSKRFEHWCCCVARHLGLEACEMRLDVEESDLQEFFDGRGLFAPLSAIKELRVSKNFEIEVRFIKKNIVKCSYLFGDSLETEYEDKDEN